MIKKTVQIINQSNQKVLATRAWIAGSPWQRMRGLLGYAGLNSGKALVLPSSSSIHTFFMKFSIDVLFLDRQNRVLKIKKEVAPYSVVLAHFWTSSVLELPAGSVNATNTQIGHQIELKPVQSESKSP